MFSALLFIASAAVFTQTTATVPPPEPTTDAPTTLPPQRTTPGEVPTSFSSSHL